MLADHPLEPIIEAIVAPVRCHHLGYECFQKVIEMCYPGFMRQAQARLGLQQQLMAQAELDRRQHHDKGRHRFGNASGRAGHSIYPIQPVSRRRAILKRSLRQSLRQSLLNHRMRDIEEIRRRLPRLQLTRFFGDGGWRFRYTKRSQYIAGQLQMIARRGDLSQRLLNAFRLRPPLRHERPHFHPARHSWPARDPQ